MGEVAVTINGRTYQMACDDGQEEHLRTLADDLARRVAELVGSVGQIGDARLLVMASLLIADELSDLRAEIVELRADAERARQDGETGLGERLNALAERIEAVAASLARP